MPQLGLRASLFLLGAVHKQATEHLKFECISEKDEMVLECINHWSFPQEF